MSCSGANGFGYVTIEDDKVVCYTGESNNPTVHKFCNDEFIQAMKLKELIEKRLELEREIYNDNKSVGKYKLDSLMIGTTLQGLLEKSKK